MKTNYSNKKEIEMTNIYALNLRNNYNINSWLRVDVFGEDCIMTFTGKTKKDLDKYYSYMNEYYKYAYKLKEITKDELEYNLNDLKREYDRNIKRYNEYSEMVNKQH